MSRGRSFLQPDPGLVRRARDGEREALERLVAALREPVMRLAISRLGDVDDAEDVAQESLVRMVRSLGSLREAEAFGGWLHRIVRNACRDRQRSRGREDARREPLKDHRDRPDPGASERGPQRVRRARLRRLLETLLRELPDRQREVYDLVELRGFEPTEVARLLELAPGSVRASLFKARRALRTRMLETRPELEEEFGP